MNAFPSAHISKEISFDNAKKVGALVPEKEFQYRVMYEDIHGWHNEANGDYLESVEEWASELLFYEHILSVIVINRDLNVMWSLTKKEYAEWFQQHADTLHAQITAKIV